MFAQQKLTLGKDRRFSLIHEYGFFYPLIVSFLALLIIPGLITWNTEPKGLVFNGVFLNITDFNVYLSAIRQGSEGRWLFQNQFTLDQFPVYFAFFPYIMMGKLLAIFGGSSLYCLIFAQTQAFSTQ